MPPHDHNHHDLGTHGMLLFGDRTLYLSHLPMFDEPHNFQVLLEITYANGDEAPAEQYRRDRQSSGEQLYTLVPEKFHLSDLVSSGFPEPPKRDSFRGTVFRGHFERGGEAITGEIEVKVSNVTYFQQLDPEAAHRADSKLTYLCFGEPGDLFAAHQIDARPDFDHVLGIALPGEGSADMGFENGTPVQFGEKDAPESRLTAGQEMDGRFFQSIGPHGEHGFNAGVRANTELYFEANELK